MHRSTSDKPVQLCIRVPDVDAWYDFGVNAFNFTLIIFLVGSAGGMLAMMWNWMSRR